jgi:8-oxo-dGTP pyrophosphatase MutT (NUDIX family)
MPISAYLRNLRAKVGHELLFMPGVTAVVLNEASQVLLQQRSDNREWSLVSGVMDPGEEPADAIVREVWEETALHVIPERITGLYTGEDFLVRYDNGDVVLYLDITFACRPVNGELPRVNDDESIDVRYFPLDGLPSMKQFHLTRLADALRNDPRACFKFDGQEGGGGR